MALQDLEQEGGVSLIKQCCVWHEVGEERSG